MLLLIRTHLKKFTLTGKYNTQKNAGIIDWELKQLFERKKGFMFLINALC